MLGLAVLVASVAALDSLNPSTVGPALVLGAVVPHAPRRVVAFAAGVFAVSTAGGIVLLIGPGHALLTRLAKPSAHTEHVAAVVCGALLLAVAAALWGRRGRSRRRPTGDGPRSRRSAFLLGSAIMAVELPTAVPYFAALIAVAAARRNVLDGVLLVLLYNAVFVLPLVVVALLAGMAGQAAAERLLELRLHLERHAPVVVPLLLAAVGLVLLAFGASALWL